MSVVKRMAIHSSFAVDREEWIAAINSVAKRLQVLDESDITESDLDGSLGIARRKLVSTPRFFKMPGFSFSLSLTGRLLLSH